MRAVDLLASVSIIINSPQPKSMCEDCGEVTVESEVHVCNPEERISAGMSAAWRQLLSGKGEKDRARGYSVQ